MEAVKEEASQAVLSLGLSFHCFANCVEQELIVQFLKCDPYIRLHWNQIQTNIQERGIPQIDCTLSHTVLSLPQTISKTFVHSFVKETLPGCHVLSCDNHSNCWTGSVVMHAGTSEVSWQDPLPGSEEVLWGVWVQNLWQEMDEW